VVSSLGPALSEVTHILNAIEQGDPSAAEQLLPLVYDELRKLVALCDGRSGSSPTRSIPACFDPWDHAMARCSPAFEKPQVSLRIGCDALPSRGCWRIVVR
jgi:hypothetical protein